MQFGGRANAIGNWSECDLGPRPDRLGAVVACEHQRIDGEALTHTVDRILFWADLEPAALAVLKIQTQPLVHAATDGGPTDTRVGPPQTQARDRSEDPFEEISHAMPTLVLLDDPTDTWSHTVDRYAQEWAAQAQLDALRAVAHGPLLWSWSQSGRIGRSDLRLEWRSYAAIPGFELRLRVDWQERHRVLKLVWGLPRPVRQRIDGTMGGQSLRPPDGREYPLQDWLRLQLEDDSHYAVVTPDVFAADVSAQSLRLTLLRSPLLAHHDPHPATPARGTYADRGQHDFRFRFRVGSDISCRELEAGAIALH